MGKYQKNIENARSVTIMQYLTTCHPGELVRKTDDEYCTKTHSSLVITPSKDLFHWFSQNIGGSSMSLVSMVYLNVTAYFFAEYVVKRVFSVGFGVRPGPRAG